MSTHDSLTLRRGNADAALDARLSQELDAHNFPASGVDNLREFTLSLLGADDELLAGLSGWTWGTCAGIAMMWVAADRRGEGLGARLLAEAEDLARERGCVQVVTSSFTFQAPGFYRRHGYVETGRVEGRWRGRQTCTYARCCAEHAGVCRDALGSSDAWRSRGLD